MMILGNTVLHTTEEIAEHIATDPNLGYLRHALLKAIVRHSKPVTLLYSYRWIRDALLLIGYDIDK